MVFFAVLCAGNSGVAPSGTPGPTPDGMPIVSTWRQHEELSSTARCYGAVMAAIPSRLLSTLVSLLWIYRHVFKF